MSDGPGATSGAKRFGAIALLAKRLACYATGMSAKENDQEQPLGEKSETETEAVVESQAKPNNADGADATQPLETTEVGEADAAETDAAETSSEDVVADTQSDSGTSESETAAEQASAEEPSTAESSTASASEAETPDADADAESDSAESDTAASKRDIERVTALFSRSEAAIAETGGAPFRFARWTRPIAPAVFGLSEESAAVMMAGFRDAAELAGVEVAESDAEYGANILLYVVDDWASLRSAPQLADLVPDLEGLTRVLSAAAANQYRIYTFTPEGGLRVCVTLLRYDEALAQLSAPSLALGQAVQTLLMWSDEAFAGESPVTVRRGGRALVKSRFARLLKAAYAAEIPAYSEDLALAETLAAGMRSRGNGDDRGGDADNASENGDDAAKDDAAKGEKSGGEDNSRRRRTRRRRNKSDSAKSSETSTADAAAETFDPLGGDPRPPSDGEDDGA